MNMKKSIAGVMAGAMAVSAMAASVSAVADQDSITLTYDLKEYAYHTTDGSVTAVQYYATADQPNYFVDATTVAALGADGYAVITFGTTQNWDMAAKSIDLSLSAAAANTGITANAAWSYTVGSGVANGAGVTVVDGTSAVFNVPVSLGAYTNTVNISGFDYDLLTTGTAAGKNYAFNAITAKMTFTVAGWMTEEKANAHFSEGSCATTQIVDANGDVVAPTTFAATEVKAGSWEMDWVKPMKSTLKTPADVVEALYTDKENGATYNNPIAVLNDAIANGTNVIFTFTSFNGAVDKDGKMTTDSDAKVWENAAFDQHLYQYDNGFSANGQGSFDYFGSYSSAWGYNLFEGAIVVNSGITMQLNQADKFIWDNNTLTFDWDTITADGKVTNAKQLLSSMYLYTSSDWYWDTLEVTVEKDAEDNASAESPITEDDDVIDDEDVADDDEIVADEETVETEATTAAVVEVPSTPNTGNASVALAVIPVALAAAAVVAKKRG